jgi:hypothetical protein
MRRRVYTIQDCGLMYHSIHRGPRKKLEFVNLVVGISSHLHMAIVLHSISLSPTYINEHGFVSKREREGVK